MRVAARMARLGTESAFEVLARARALERAGREIVHLEIGEPDFDTPAHIKRPPTRAPTGARRHTGPSAALPERPEPSPSPVAGQPAVRAPPDEAWVRPA